MTAVRQVSGKAVMGQDIAGNRHRTAFALLPRIRHLGCKRRAYLPLYCCTYYIPWFTVSASPSLEGEVRPETWGCSRFEAGDCLPRLNERSNVLNVLSHLRDIVRQTLYEYSRCCSSKQLLHKNYTAAAVQLALIPFCFRNWAVWCVWYYLL